MTETEVLKRVILGEVHFDTTMRVNRLSVCPCGYALYNEWVELGDIYHVDLNLAVEADMQCGGCKRILKVRPVWGSNNRGAGWILLDALEADRSN